MIGKKVRQRREELGLTQEELAHKMGFQTKSAINKIEKDVNDINQSKLIKLAEALECSPSYFIDNQQSNPDASNEIVMAYAEKLSQLPPEKLNNVMQYIDFLKQGDKK